MRIIFEGARAYNEYKKLLKNAQERIWICMYMIRFDDSTKELWSVLEEKHEAGVDVTVWYDLVGSLRSLPRLAACPFAKLFLPRITRLNTRNHAKAMLVDDKGIVSGRNFTKRYYDDWVDTSIVLEEGDEIASLEAFTKHIEQAETSKEFLNENIRVTNPLKREKGVYNFVLEHIVKSQKRIMIATPYFVIDDAIESLLLAAADRGVDITIIVPATPEHRLARTFNRINFQRIHHDNVTVMRSAGMFHSKVMLFDNTALVGSANFDNRSFKYNMELSVVLKPSHARTVVRHLNEVADHSVEYNWVQRAYDAILFSFTRHLMELL